MNINYKESQIDFLSNAGGKAEASVPPRYMAAQMSLSLENLVIFGIVAIMIVIFSFSLGIERGKGVVMTTTGEPVPDARSAMTVPTGSVKADKASGKTEAKEFKADTQKMKSAPSASKAVAKAKPASVAAVTVVKAAESGAYTLQVASYKGIKSAQREADKLKQKGFDNVYVLPKGTYTIVCVGNFQNKEDASGMKRQLNNRYQGSVVRRL
jgi:cell division septation protein DedD